MSKEANKAKSFWREPEFWLLLVAALASVFGVAWWVVLPLTVAGLSISSLPKYIELWPRAKAAGAEAEWWKTVLLSTLNNLAAACGAFVLRQAHSLAVVVNEGEEQHSASLKHWYYCALSDHTRCHAANSDGLIW